MNNADAASPNAKRLLWAGFMAIMAAGVGFSIRAGILKDWGTQFGFTQSDLGNITGGGLTGFGIVILLGALIADKVGYGRLMISAFVMHFISAVLTLAATPIFKSMVDTDPEGARAAAYQCLFWGMFLFAIGNGLAEAVVNPLVATLFPKEKTHYLNILHAGWPAGLIVGGVASFFMVDKVRWEIQMSLFIVPVVLYGVMCLGQRFPKSEASQHGITFGEMLKEFVAPVLLLLLVIHALVGYVELGTDSWIANITGNVFTAKTGILLLVYTSGLMFVLRFFAGPIVHRISSLGLLFVSAIFGCVGLLLTSQVTTVGMALIALAIYGVGKTFLWPTMLGVVSERFPKGGAITIGAVGAVGMLSAGLLGGPGIGYKQDYFAADKLKTENAAVYDLYKSEKKNRFLFFPEIQGLDGAKVGPVREKAQAQKAYADAVKLGTAEGMTEVSLTPEEKLVHEADIYGGRTAIKVTAGVPAVMALLYGILLLYFKSKGGYKPVHIEGVGSHAREVPSKA